MIRAVLDTNVLASGFVGFASSERAPGRLLRLWRDQRFTLVVSPEILAELLNTFADPYFLRQLTPDQINSAQSLLEKEASVTLLTVPVSGVATHPEDDVVLATAVSAEIQYLVTGDRKLQQLRTFQGVSILAPRAFLDLVEVTDGDEP